MGRDSLKKFYEFLLMLISGGVVVILLITNKPPWQMVCSYWAVLTIKNINDLLNKPKIKGEI